MKIKNQLIIISLSIILITSSLTIATAHSTIEPTIHQITLETATKAAENKLLSLEKTAYQIGNFETITNHQNTIIGYIFHLTPIGYIVISAYYQLPPVIAYSFTQPFHTIQSQATPLLQLLQQDLQLRINNIPNLPQQILTQRTHEWNNYLSEELLITPPANQWPQTTQATLDDYWLETTWHQNAPYNNFCPIDKSSGDRSVAGCPAVAMGQILNYHQTIHNTQFSDDDDYFHNYAGNAYWIDNDYIEYEFPAFPDLNTYLNTLTTHYNDNIPITDDDKAALIFACGVAARQVYHPTGSGTFGVSQAEDAYLRFNFTEIDLLTDDDPDLYDKIIANIQDALPVHLAVVNPEWTAGHNLVIDGYNTDGYYHLNFGWGGPQDGWYLLPDDIPYGLTVIEGVIVDIIPNTSGSNLQSQGSLSWTDIPAGATVHGNFTIENVGEPGYSIDWEITTIPEWGTWTFTPDSGTGFTPEDGPLTIHAKVVAPNEKNEEFSGTIKIENINNEDDSCLVHVALATPKTVTFFSFIEWLQNQLPWSFPIFQLIYSILSQIS